MAINLISPTTFTTAVLIGDAGPSVNTSQGGDFESPPFMTQANGSVVSAALEVQSTTGGFLLPRMTQAQINALPTPIDGLMVFNTTTQSVSFYNGTYNSNTLFNFTFPITSANILGMNANPVQILPPPGVGFMYQVYYASIEIFAGTTSYIQGGELHIQYGNTADGAGPTATDLFLPTLLTNSTASNNISVAQNFFNDGDSIISTSVNNVGLYLTNDTLAFRVGNRTGSLYLVYAIVPVN